MISTFDKIRHMPIFDKKTSIHIHGDCDQLYVAFAHKSGDYSLRCAELYNLEWYYIKIENDSDCNFFCNHVGIILDDRFSFPFDLAYTYSQNVAAFCSPIPCGMTINKWINQLYNLHNKSNKGQFALPTKLIACLAITLWFNRDPEVLLEAQRKRQTLREFFVYHSNALNFLLEQRRPLWDFKV